MNWLRCSVIVGVSFLCLSTASGAVLFDQSVFSLPPDSTLAGSSDSSQSFIRAGKFQVSLGGTNTARGVTWFGVYYSGSAPVSDDFTVAFHAQDTNGLPQLAPFASYAVGNVSRVSVGLVNADLGLREGYEYFAAIPDTLLDSGVPYWLSIFNDTPGPEFWGWRAASNALGGAGLSLVPSGQQWGAGNNYAPAFVITSVPEPSTVGLMVLGGLGAVALIRRRR